MIAGLKPYPEYRESGHLWIGSLPSHWKVVRNGNLFLQRNQTGYAHLPVLEVSLKTGIRIRNFDGSARKQVMSDFTKYKRAAKGDIAYNMMRMWQGAIGVVPIDGLVSPAYVVATPFSGVLSSYYSYLFRTGMYLGEIDACSRGIVKDRNRLYWEQFKQMASVLPPPEEQAAIVRFLDYANRRLERAIRAKRKIISLLNEQKQAIIHRAVTRGLDPNVPLKPSGIPWLGEIPAHWEVVPLKGLCKIQSGVTLGKNYLGVTLTEYPYLRVANVQAGHLNLNEVKTLPLPVEEARRSILKYGDVLMTEGGDPDKLGRGCVWEEPISQCIHQNHVFAVRPDQSRLKSHYLSALLDSDYAKRYFLLTAKQTTNLASTNKTTIGLFRVPLPSLEEQKKILDTLERGIEPALNTIAQTEREIFLLREYQTRLVADVVTGKIDVRNAAAKLSKDNKEVPAMVEEEDLSETEMTEMEQYEEE